MKKFLFIPFVLFASLFFASCEKEFSTETGGTPNSGLALFTLDGGSSTCTGAVLNGTYKAGVALGTGNTVVLQVDVDSIGGYTINTGAVNGITFSGTGTFSATGPQTITLTGSGTPTTAGDFSFSTGAASCSFSVTVTPNGGSSSGTAVYTYNGGTSSCTGAVLAGIYTQGTALASTNTVALQVDVTTVGSYDISTTAVNGVVFSGTGTFAATGPQTITLTGAGTPVAAGSFNFVPGATGCTFSVTFTGSVLPDCKSCQYFPSCVNSTYTFSDTLNGVASEFTSTYNTSVDTTIGGVVFQKIGYTTTPASSASNTVLYYNCSAGVTTLKAYNSVTVISGTTIIEATTTPIKENAAVNTSWTDAVTIPGPPDVTNEQRFSIVEKGITWVAGGTTFNDVIHIHLETGATVMGVYTVGSTTEYYYAKGVGLIEAITYNVIFGTPQLVKHQVIKTYFIP